VPDQLRSGTLFIADFNFLVCYISLRNIASRSAREASLGLPGAQASAAADSQRNGRSSSFRLSRLPGEGKTKRAEEDAYAKLKYDATADQDNVIIGRVAELAQKHGVSMTEVSLAWLIAKVASPVVGATKIHHIEGAARAVDLELTGEELTYLEERYVPHPLAGVMAQNKPAAANEKHVWSTGDQKIGR